MKIVQRMYDKMGINRVKLRISDSDPLIDLSFIPSYLFRTMRKRERSPSLPLSTLLCLLLKTR